MAVYAYKAMDSSGRIVSGEMDAINPVDLEMRLKHMGLDLIDGSPARRFGLFRGGIPRRALINFTFHLDQLTRSGVPLLEGLADLRDSIDPPRFREVIAGLIEGIEGGKTLSQAMAGHPEIFDEVFRSLIQAGEATGRLPDVFRSLTESMKWQDELAAQTKKLIIYPSIMAAIVLGVTFFMMVYLVPKMAVFIRSVGQELPFHTRALIAASDFFVAYWYLILAAPPIATVLVRMAAAGSGPVRYRLDAMRLRLPVVGEILHKISLSRFANVFAMMYASGIPVLDILRATRNVVGNAVIRDGLERAEGMIEDGQNITAAFQQVGMFPPLVTRMLKVGESTGALDTALMNVSYFFNRDVKESVDRLQALIEPVMTLVVGLILGWVMLSVLGPIYDVVTQLKL